MNLQELRAATVSVKKSAVIENIAVRIKDIEINEDKPSYFVGNRLDNNEEIAVRLMTVDEAVGANLRRDDDGSHSARLLNYFNEKFVSGTHTRPKPEQFADKTAKEHVQPGGVVLFDRAIPNDDGTYRAQWASTIAPSPEQEALKVVLHLDGREENAALGQKATVRATVLHPEAAVLLDKKNGLQTLQAMMTNKDTAGKPRSPAPILRVALSDGTSTHAIIPTMTTHEMKKDFNTGVERKVVKVMEPAAAIDAILASPDLGKTQNGKIVKALVAGLTGKPANWTNVPEAAQSVLQRLSKSVADGSLPVIAIPGERLYAGNAAAKKMVADATRPNTPMGKTLNRVETQDVTVRDQTVKTTLPLYTEAYIGIMRHKDTKAPYLRDVFLTSPWPKFAKLTEVELGPNSKAPEVGLAEPDDDLPDTPLDAGFSDSDIDAGLAASTADNDDDAPSPM